LRNAAAKAKAVAMTPTRGAPKAKPANPTTAKIRPTNWANRKGCTGKNQYRQQDRRGDPGGEAGSAHVDLIDGGGVLGNDRHERKLLELLAGLDDTDHWGTAEMRDRREGARLLSSYNNNSNSPRCGTGPLRDAW
jgi:hypothetical protein